MEVDVFNILNAVASHEFRVQPLLGLQNPIEGFDLSFQFFPPHHSIKPTPIILFHHSFIRSLPFWPPPCGPIHSPHLLGL